MTEYMFCAKCNLKYEPNVLYCSQCGTPTIPRGQVAVKKTPLQKLEQTLLSQRAHPRFPFLRFIANLLDVIGGMQLLAALVLGVILSLGGVRVIQQPTSFGALAPPLLFGSYFLAFVVWLFGTLSGIFTIAFGELLKVLITQSDEVQTLNLLLTHLAWRLMDESH